jgi:hypothetical protein
MNDICLDKQQRSIYKVKLWNTSKDVALYVFVGPQKGREDIRDVLSKIESKQKLKKPEEALLSGTFGKNYAGLLGLKESSPVHYVYHTIHRDDTVAIVKN